MTPRHDDPPPHHIADLLPGYVNGTLDGAELVRVRAHLQRCAGCRVELAAWQSLAAATRSAEETALEAAPYLLDRVWSTIDQDDRASSRALRAPQHPITAVMKRNRYPQERIMDLTSSIKPTTGGFAPALERRDDQVEGRRRRRTTEFAATAVILLTLVAGYLAFRTAPPPGGGEQGSVPGMAQRGTPDPEQIVDIPDLCTVEPRAIVDVAQVLEVPVDENGAPIIPTPVVQGQPPEILPEGTAADEATLEAVNAVWSDYWTCVATGDRLGSYALLTDDGVRRVFYRSDQSSRLPAWVMDVLNTEAAATPPAPESAESREKSEPRPPVMLIDARVLPDGRVAALLYPGPDKGQYEAAGYVVFLQVDGRWLIDDFVFYVG